MMSYTANKEELVREFVTDELKAGVYTDTESMGRNAAVAVAKKINELLKEKEEINMIFAAAPSQLSFLKHLVSDESVDFTRINAFHMDEYIGIGKENSRGFAYFLTKNLFGLVNFKSVNCIKGDCPDAFAECERYTELLDRFPVDIVCLGIGENGHIAFNDPGVAKFDDPASVKIARLDEVCRRQQVNEKCFDTLDSVPKEAITLTVPALTRAAWMYCIVPFTNKAEAVRRTIRGEISEDCPSTILRKKRNAELFLTTESASLL